MQAQTQNALRRDGIRSTREAELPRLALLAATRAAIDAQLPRRLTRMVIEIGARWHAKNHPLRAASKHVSLETLLQITQ